MSRSRVSRIGLPLSRLSRTASRRECRCTSRARAYRKRARACGDNPAHRGAAVLAAATAASTSALLPCATRARTDFVAGLIVSKYWPSAGATEEPLMKWPKRPPSSCLIHSSAGASLSGAGPYSMVSNSLATEVTLDHRVAVRGGVAPGHEMLELALDIGEQRAGAEAEQRGFEPAVAQLFLHQDHPLE